MPDATDPPYAIPQRQTDAIARAQGILRGQSVEPQEMLQLAKQLKNELRFGYARRVLLRASKHERITNDQKLRKTIMQQLALCTYKDQDLPADTRLDRALEILRQIEDLNFTTDQETLGLAGAIFKRRWEVDTQRSNLESSLFYYLRGYREGPVHDQGYTGINAAFVHDQLASLEESEARKAGQTSPSAPEHRASAAAIRRDIIDQVGPLIAHSDYQWIRGLWWYYATMAEAHFGLQQFDEALRWLREGQSAANQINEWEMESCARQLAALARMQDTCPKGGEFTNSRAWEVIREAFGSDAAARTAFGGKVGLALSGGGFRASLYHIGVLACLAEMDLLRHVEVLSCVSGGSIVGAYYYLLVRRLLQSKTQDQITSDDYVAIVRELADEFLIGVQDNIRMRLLVNPFKTLRMIWRRDYSRTKRAGELYERHLYSRIDDGEKGERWLNELRIAPLTKGPDGREVNDENFAPVYQNWRRTSKVPILVLNAATLNTGHTWQFTATWMGESPAAIDSEVDGNDRLRRMYYSEAPTQYQKIRLGDAVGASAAVPGIFEPLSMDHLYPDRIIRLVDGGVCDNQGVSSLLEQDCRVMLVSDASGQMESQPAVSQGIIGVLLRTNSIFQARIRGAEYKDLKARHRSGLLRGFMFVHLKGDLEIDPIDWVGCEDPYDASDDARPPSRRGPLTRYGIGKDVQELLSGVRTDLDSFSDAEAYALMTSGYRMTEFQLDVEKYVQGFESPRKPQAWKFLEIERVMKSNPNTTAYLKRLLAAGSSIGLKVWQIDPWLRYGSRIAVLATAVMVVVATIAAWDPVLFSIAKAPGFLFARTGPILPGDSASLQDAAIRSFSIRTLVLAGAGVVGGYALLRLLGALAGDFLARNVIRAVRWKDTLRQIVLAVVLSTVGFAISVVHLLVFDRRFLRLGRLEHVLKKSSLGKG